MGICPFLAQRRALRYAEAVLLVHHDKAQLFKLHVLLNDGVRADDNVDFAVYDPLVDFPLVFGGHCPDQQRDRYWFGQYPGVRIEMVFFCFHSTGGGKEFVNCGKVLLRQDFRRRH